MNEDGSCFENCPYAKKIEKIEVLERDVEDTNKDLQEVKAKKQKDHKEFYEKIDEVKNELSNVKVDFAVVNTKLHTIMTQMTTMAADVAVLKDRPAKKWDSATTTVVSSIVSGIIGVAVGKLL